MLQPVAIFATLDGSLPFAAWPFQNPMMIGVKMKIMAGLTAWSHEPGTSHPRRKRSVFLSAHFARVLPCCS